MKTTVAIDPGVNHCGLAIFDGPVLVYAKLVKNKLVKNTGKKTWLTMASAVQHDFTAWVFANDCGVVSRTLILERPQVYVRGKGDNNDLIDLAGIIGVIAGRMSPVWFDDVVFYKPHDWKGNVKKEVMTERIKGWLSEKELKLVEKTAPASLLHNVLDAAGLGLVHLRKTGVRK